MAQSAGLTGAWPAGRSARLLVAAGLDDPLTAPSGRGREVAAAAGSGRHALVGRGPRSAYRPTLATAFRPVQNAGVIWRDFEASAPALARIGRERFDRTRVAMIATLRQDGSPRISPIEPVFAMGHLLLGAMPSEKVRDLRRDSRCALHNSVSDINGSEGEFRLQGRALPADDQLSRGDYDAWWKRFAPDRATVFYLTIESAISVSWEITSGEFEVSRWSPDRGTVVERRRYP